MKKILSLVLAFAMLVTTLAVFTACGGNDGADMKVAMVTDYGDITDQSFNQSTYEACKEWCEANKVTFKYFKPADNNTDARVASVEQAINEGFNIIVLPGYAFAGTIVKVQDDYPDVKFVALDVAAGDILSEAIGESYTWNPDDYDLSQYLKSNVFCAVYQEELSGFMAGVFAVEQGYRHLGFLGGMAVPAVIRFGYGFVQGANYAADALGVEVVIEYAYGNQFFGDDQITAYTDNWYQTKGVEVVFACGGGIYTSAAESAKKVNGKVIGVDVDQKATIDGFYGEGMTITSAMKGLQPTVKLLLNEIKAGNWDNYKGQIINLGLVSGTDPEANYVQIPYETSQWSDKFTQDDYKELVKGLYDKTIKVSNDTVNAPATGDRVTVNYYGNIK